MISKPTRVYKYSQTIIDNIFTNSYNTILNHYILERDISDHYPLILTTQNGEQEKSEVTLQRKITKKNIDSFIRTVNSLNFTDILHMKSSCEAYCKLHQILTDAYNKSFPLTKPRSTYKQRLPWVDGQLQNLIKIKNKMYLKSRTCPTIENQQIYKKIKLLVNKCLKYAKRNYYKKLLSEAKNDMKKHWHILKEIIGKISPRSIQPSSPQRMGSVK